MDIKIKAKEIMVKDIQKINLSASQKISDIKDKDKVQFKCNNITYPKKKYQIMKNPSYLVENSHNTVFLKTDVGGNENYDMTCIKKVLPENDYNVTYLGSIDVNEEDNYDITYIGFVYNINKISQ